MTQDNRDKFSYIAGRYGQFIKFYNVEEVCAEGINYISQLFKGEQNRDGFFIGKFYRLLIPQALPNTIEKAIYLDSDVIVNLDINELWRVELDNKPLANVTESINGINPEDAFVFCQKGLVSSDDYFNSGVLVINLKQIRQNEMENLLAGIRLRAEIPESHHFDQEILNYCFSRESLKLPHRFNFFAATARQRGEYNTCNRICHYAGNSLNLDIEDNFNRLWFKYFIMTPWFNEEMILNLDETYMKIINQRDEENKNLTIKMMALMSGKVRAFFTESEKIDDIKKFFLIRDGEEIIPLVNQKSFQTLAKSMAESRGKKIFFILFAQYDKLRDELKKIGFVEGQDFINASMFLSDANGVSINTYDLVKAL